MGWWILGAVLALVLLVLWCRVGAEAEAREGAALLRVRFGFLSFQVYPGREKSAKEREKEQRKQAKKAKKKRKKEEKEQAEGKEKKEKETFRLAPEDIRDALETLPPPLFRALRRIFRGIRVDPLTLELTLAGEPDPAKAARNYGRLNALVFGFMPVLEGWLDIPDPFLRVDVDFTLERSQLEGRVGITARVITLLLAGLGALFALLGWYLRVKKRQKKKPDKPEKADKTDRRNSAA